VVSRLSQPDAVALLDQDPVDTAPLHAAAELQRLRLDELARAFADGVIDARQLQEGSESGRARLAEIERELASAVRTTELDGLAGAPDVAEVWQQLDLSRRRAVVSALVVVTVQPGAGRGRQADGGYFDPESIGVTWR
jgi:site-specific DNA recombinase